MWRKRAGTPACSGQQMNPRSKCGGSPEAENRVLIRFLQCFRNLSNILGFLRKLVARPIQPCTCLFSFFLYRSLIFAFKQKMGCGEIDLLFTLYSRVSRGYVNAQIAKEIIVDLTICPFICYHSYSPQTWNTQDTNRDECVT